MRPGSLGRPAKYPSGLRIRRSAPGQIPNCYHMHEPLWFSVLDVSTSSCYAWRKRGPSKRDREAKMLTERIRVIHERSRSCLRRAARARRVACDGHPRGPWDASLA